MAKPKFKQYFENMFAENKNLFLQFKVIHDDYAKDRKNKDEFDEVGKKVSEILKEWEGRLCGHMEKGANANYSANLAEKYWQEIRKYYPFIDHVGIKIRKVKV